MRTTLRLVRALVAAAAILAILSSVPVLVWFVGGTVLGDLVAEGLPGWETVSAVLSRPDDGRLLIGLVLVVAVAAWAVLAYSIAAELVAVLARRPTPAINLPVFRGSRAFAAILVGALLGASYAPALASTAAPTGIVGEPVPGPGSGSGALTDPLAPPTRTYEVVSGDSFWRIAERELGDPWRWREIYDLNKGRVQADGTRVTEAGLLYVGWMLLLPHPTSTDGAGRPVVTVQPGDTLTGIAAAKLGDRTRAGEIFDLNRRRPQPDGGRLAEPDLIQPGWRLALPDDPDHAPPPPRTTQTGAPAPSGAPALPPAEQSTRPPSPAPTAAPPMTPPPAAARSNGEGSAPAAPEESAGVAVPVSIAASALVLAGLVTVLAVRRRRQLHLRRPRHRIAVPDDHAGRIEWLAAETEPTLDVTFLDLALRGLVQSDWTDADVPALCTVVLGADHAWITLREPAALPQPFTTTGDIREFQLDAAAALLLTAEEASGVCAPYPALVSVATDHTGNTLLVDLEEIGVAHITGNPAASVGLLRHIAAELANAPWAADMEIVVAGFGDELEPLNTERLHIVPDLATGLTAVESRIREADESLDELGLDSLIAGRLQEDMGRLAWVPVVLLACGPATDADRATLTELAAAIGAEHRRPAAVLVAGVALAGQEIHIADGGTLVMPGIGDGWRAEYLAAATGRELAAVMESTRRPDQPAPPATGTAGWTAGMTEDGSLDASALAEPVITIEASGDATADGIAAAAPARAQHTVDGDPTGSPATATSRARAPGSEIPPADPDAMRLLEIVNHQDPNLDEDLHRWAEEHPQVPMISILGMPQVRAPGREPEHRRSWYTELLVYLALRPVGATPDQALTDLWPDGRHVSAATLRAAFYRARRWAGTGLDGDPALPFLSEIRHGDGTYRLQSHMLDWDLFRRLRKRAQARHAAGHDGAVADYDAALGLVRGPVLHPLRKGGYAWLHTYERYDLQIPGYIVDAAHELVDITLAGGDTEHARRAAETARLVDPDIAFDRPLLDLMRIANADNRPSELERFATILLDARDPTDELADDTFDVLNALVPNRLRHRR